MKIDFHTHAFADSIAERAIKKLMSVDTMLKNGRLREPTARQKAKLVSIVLLSV